MMRRKIAGLIIVAIVVLSVTGMHVPVFAVTGNTYYVNGTTGSDSNNGLSDGAPFKTINKAAQVAAAGDTVFIHGGTYRETITPLNSGSSGSPINYKAVMGETVTVNGTDILTGWTLDNGSIYKAPMSWTLGKGRDEVFVDGNVLVQARYPQASDTSKSYEVKNNSPLSPLWPVKGDFNAIYNTKNIFSTSLLTQTQSNYYKDAIYNGGHGWNWAWQSGIVDTSTQGLLTLKQTTTTWWFNLAGDSHGDLFPDNQQGYLTDSMNFLTYPGGWETSNGYLYLWTAGSDNPSGHTVEVKKRNLAFDLRGKSYINITGINVFASSMTMYQASNIVIDSCQFSYISHFLLWDDARDGYIDGKDANGVGAPQRGEVGIYIGGQNNIFKNSTIRYSAGAGLFLTGLNATITNNNIHDCGYAGTYLGNIFISYDPGTTESTIKGGHTITNNTLYNGGRALIHVSSFNTSTNTSYNSMEISNNILHDGMILDQDGGSAFYGWQMVLNADGKRTQVHHNIMYNSWGDYWAAVTYCDNKSYGIDIHDNIIWNNPNPNAVKTNNHMTTLNTPNDVNMYNNTVKDTFKGGISDLTLLDYPNNTSFAAGSNHDDGGNSLPQQPALSMPRTSWHVSASSSLGSNTPDLAIDSASNTKWTAASTQTNGQYFQINLGQRYDATQLLLTSAVNEFPVAYSVYLSNDGFTWGNPAASGAGSNGTMAITLPQTSAQFIKIVQTGTSASPWSIDDINISGIKSATDKTFIATNADDYTGAVTKQATYINNTLNGSSVSYKNVDMNRMYSNFSVHLATADPYATETISLRIDSVTGPVIGSLVTSATQGGWTGYEERVMQLAPVSGVHDLYITFSYTSQTDNSCNIDWFKLSGPTNDLEINGQYKIQPVTSVGSAVYGNIGHAQLVTYTSDDSQKWILQDAGQGYYKVVSKINTANVLGVPNTGNVSGTLVQVMTDNGGDGQKWRLLDAGYYHYYLESLASPGLNISLASLGSSTLQLSTASTSDDLQKWFVSSVTPAIAAGVCSEPMLKIVAVGKTTSIYSYAYDKNGTIISLDTSKLSFSSATPSIATVDSAGVVTGVAPGNATINISYMNEQGTVLTYSNTLKISDVQIVSSSVSAPAIVKVNTTGQVTIKATFSDGSILSNVPSSNYTITSSNTNIATVSSTGSITGVAPGTVTITANVTYNGLTRVATTSVIIPATKNAYATFNAKDKEDFYNTAFAADGSAKNTKAGGWLEYASVDFGTTNTGSILFTLNSGAGAGYEGGIVEIHLDSPTGTLAGSAPIATANGWNSAPTFAYINAISGVHDVYFVYAKGTSTGYNTTIGNIFSFSFKLSTSKSAYTTINAIDCDMYSNVTLVTTNPTKANNLKAGGWLSYGNVDFGAPPINTLMVTVNAGTDTGFEGGLIEVRLDSATGTLLGTVPIPKSGWASTPTTVTSSTTVTGVHTVYLVMNKGAATQNTTLGNLYSFVFARS